MKVCILSMQSVDNFGSLLQAYSLKQLLMTLDVEVAYIDIEKNESDNFLVENKFDSEEKIIRSLSKIKKIDRYFINRLSMKNKYKEQNKKFDDFRLNMLNIKGDDNNKKYDCCIIGSDEVFNCMSQTQWGFTSQLFGNVRQADKVITYAASCGSTIYSQLPDGVKERIRQAFCNIQSFSARDENTISFIQNMTDMEVTKHFDPVVIGDFTEEISKEMMPKRMPKKYCVIYSYYNRINTKEEIQPILNFCKRHNLTPVTVGAPQMWVKHHLVLNPFQALLVFKYADFVITDTFHGTIFSSKYAKKFATKMRESNEQKLSDLVKGLQLEKHVVNSMEDLDDAYKVDKNSVFIDEVCTRERERSVQYLKTNLQMI